MQEMESLRDLLLDLCSLTFSPMVWKKEWGEIGDNMRSQYQILQGSEK